MRKSEIILLAILAAQARLCAGINVWTSHGPGGGSIAALAIDPKNSNTVYVGTVVAGIFKSTDGGASWQTASSGLRPGSVSSLAIDQQNPSTLYALSNGLMFKSTDGGQSWLVVYSSPTGGPSSLALDPQNRGTVYFGTCNGVFKSQDGGVSWSAANSGLPVPGFCINILVLDPQNPKTVYAGIGQFPGELFKSTDGGASWISPLKQKLIDAGKSPTHTCDEWGYYFARVMDRAAPAPEDIFCFPGGNRNSVIAADQYIADLQYFANTRPNDPTAAGADIGLITGVTALVVDPQNPSTVYAVTLRGIFKSTDGGVSWNAANSGLPANAEARTLAIDSKNPGTVYTTVNHCEAAGCGLQLYKSMDGAVSWNPSGSRLSTNSGSGPLAIDPQTPSTLYAGTSAGLIKSTDGAASWSPANSGLAATDIGSLAVDPQNRGILFARAEGVSGVFKSADGGTSWASTGLPAADFVTVLTVDPQNPATVYAGICCAPTHDTGLFKSLDGGTSWTETGGLTQGVSLLTIDPQNPSTLYAEGLNLGAGILKSTDGGATWSAWNSGLATAGTNAPSIGFLTLEPQSPNTLYVYASSGQIFTSTDGAGSWSAMNLGWDPRLFNVSALVADPQTPGTLYAGTTVFNCDQGDCPPDYDSRVAATPGPGLFKSTDGGQSWVKLNGPAAGDVNVLAIDPRNPSTLYVATGFYPSSVFRSTDGGASWNAVSSGLISTYVRSLAVDGQNPSTLYAATSGGGVFAITFAPQ